MCDRAASETLGKRLEESAGQSYREKVAVSNREAQLGTTFVRLADSLVTGFDVIDLLHDLVSECKRVLEVAEAGLVLEDSDGILQNMTSTSERCAFVEEQQVELGEGPCIDAFRGGSVVTIDDIANEQKWPAFREVALASGFRSVHAIPMRLRTDIIGAINLFGDTPGALTRADASVGAALADIATIAILQHRLIDEQSVVSEQLQSALNSRVLIEQAKGVIAQSHSVSMDEAFARLRSHARSNGEILRDVAERVVTENLQV